MSPPGRLLDWMWAGEEHFAATVARVKDWDIPSRLPGWSRRTVLAHVARNADALHNLFEWARTGVETPMYASPEARADDIAATALQPVDALVADYRQTTVRLRRAVEGLPDTAWSRPVRTAQGRLVPAAEVPWMRCRETWVHAADLDAGAGLDTAPEAILAALVDDVLTVWARRGVEPGIALAATDAAFARGASSEDRRVTGRLGDIAAWVTGRGDTTRLVVHGAPAELPSWL